MSRPYPYLPQYTAAWLRSQNRHQRHPARRGENVGGLSLIHIFTYISEFSSSICKDTGYQTIAVQIEVFSKLTILAMGMPILLALLETIQEFLV